MLKFFNKKTAMFGLEGEPLKKQSGELFLARLQRLTFRLVEGHQATRLLNSKAAMFGLDARIALAIFGTLSVIMGAALYSAIQKSKMTALITTMENHAKAIEAYMLDTGQNIPDDPDYPTYHLQIGELLTSTAPGWKGPYLPHPLYSLKTTSWDYISGLTAKLKSIGINTLYFQKQAIDGWSDLSIEDCDDPGEVCYYFIRTDTEFSLNSAKQIDLLVDGNDSPFTGKLRYQDWGADNEYSIYFMGPRFM